METVKAFNAELSSLYDVKPPISKAKMTAITKGAIKAVKFYKHVVQSVEKFLQKCRPEYKIPGLYVIDSIVRQSRHQFGSDKDVFAPRFSKNINITFYFIYQCTTEEKSKVIRVLNLWQRNTVFPPEVIQPLFDMADVSHPKYKEVAQIVNSKGASSSGMSISKSLPAGPGNSQESLGSVNGIREVSIGGYEETSNDGSQLQGQPLIMGNLPNLNSTEMSLAKRLQHLQHLFHQEPSVNSGPNTITPTQVTKPAPQVSNQDTGQIRFNKKLLDFDYDDEDDEPNQSEKIREIQPPQQQQQQQTKPPQHSSAAVDTLGNLLTNPDILRHLQSLQQQISQPAVGLPGIMNSNLAQQPSMQANNSGGSDVKSDATSNRMTSFPSIDLTQPPPGFAPMSMGLPLPLPLSIGLPPHAIPMAGLPHPQMNFPQTSGVHNPPLHVTQEKRDDFFPSTSNNGETTETDQNRFRDRDRDRRRSRTRSRSGSRTRSGQRTRHRKSRSRSRSRDRDRRRRSSRSRSRSRSPSRNRRRRSRSKDREEREKERLEREKERDRKRKGLPAIRKEHLSVCSTTLWVGHLSKLVQQEELSDTFGQYGEIVSIDLIPPRGCAFVCMHRRQDAYRALNKLAGHKLQGKAITLAWAPGKGVKAKEWKDYWEVEQGVSYIPWNKLVNFSDWEAMEEGGAFDEETLPPWMRNSSVEAPSEVQILVPPGFIPIPEANSLVGPGPPTPETVSENSVPAPSSVGPASVPSSVPPSIPTTLPPNLPTYAMAPLGLLSGTGLVPTMPLGMPAGLRLPPPGLLVGPPHSSTMPNLIGQSLLAGLGPPLGSTAVGVTPSLPLQQMNIQQGSGPGFFGVFPPTSVANQNNQSNVQSNEDDMDLEEAEEEQHKEAISHQNNQMEDVQRERDRSWKEEDDENQVHNETGSQDQKPTSLPSLLERLRNLANSESVSTHTHSRPLFEHDHNGTSVDQDRDRMRLEGGPLILRQDMGIGANVGMSLGGMEHNPNSQRFALSPNLASSLRGAPLTAAPELGVRLLRPGMGSQNDPFGPPRGTDDHFTPRHLLGLHGGTPFGTSNSFTSLRGPPPGVGIGGSPNPRLGLPGSSRGMLFDGRGPRGGFRPPLDGGDSDRRPPWDEEMRWRDREDERFRDGPSEWGMDRDFPDRERHWRDREMETRLDRDRIEPRRNRDWSNGGRRPPRTDRERGGSGNRDRFGRDRDRGDRRGRSGDRDRDRERRGERRGGRWGGTVNCGASGGRGSRSRSRDRTLSNDGNDGTKEVVSDVVDDKNNKNLPPPALSPSVKELEYTDASSTVPSEVEATGTNPEIASTE